MDDDSKKEVAKGKALRFNQGKPDWTLLDYESLLPAVNVMTFGATKYARENWKLPVDDPKQHLQSAMRHLIAMIQGQEIDFDSNCEDCKRGSCKSHSGERHSGHIICNMMMYNYHTKSLKSE